MAFSTREHLATMARKRKITKLENHVVHSMIVPSGWRSPIKNTPEIFINAFVDALIQIYLKSKPSIYWYYYYPVYVTRTAALGFSLTQIWRTRIVLVLDNVQTSMCCMYQCWFLYLVSFRHFMIHTEN